jgi:hypothetical protein
MGRYLALHLDFDGPCHEADNDEIEMKVHPNDSLLLFSDGAVEIHNAEDKMLGVEGLIAIRKPSRATHSRWNGRRTPVSKWSFLKLIRRNSLIW